VADNDGAGVLTSTLTGAEVKAECDGKHPGRAARVGPYTADQCYVCWRKLNPERAQKKAAPPKRRELPQVVENCRHRGAEAEVVACPSCQGGWKIKVFSCALHGRCHLWADKALDSVKKCHECRDREPRRGAGESPALWDKLPDPLPEPEIAVGKPSGWHHLPAVRKRHRDALRLLLETDLPDPEIFVPGSEGIVVCGGGRYWPMVVAACKMARDVTALPIQVWHRGREEVVGHGDLDGVPGISFRDATKVSPAPRIMRGWETKTVAILHSGFEKVVYLDADAYLVSDPAPLLDACTEDDPFLFWQDLPHQDGAVNWEAFDLPASMGVPAIQGGQLVLHRRHFWRQLLVAHWLNQHSDYCYSLFYGDQDAYRVALAATGGRYRNFGRAPWKYPAFVCGLPGCGGRWQEPRIIHRPRGKAFPGNYTKTTHLPGDDRYWRYFEAVPGVVKK
jgi:hypothetical protein